MSSNFNELERTSRLEQQIKRYDVALALLEAKLNETIEPGEMPDPIIDEALQIVAKVQGENR